jgi:uncharacterized membrane protein (DUF106 family)
MNTTGIDRHTPQPVTDASKLAELQKQMAEKDAEIKRLKEQVIDAALQTNWTADERREG